MATIYISSTYVDLIEERKAADKAVRRLGHSAIAMEDYVASNQRPVDKCLADVRRCDAYVGIFAWRYGHIPKGYDKSITHLEYEASREAGIPCLIFILAESAEWPRNQMDRGDKEQRIEKLRKELQNEHVVSSFTNADDLNNKVSAAVNNLKLAATDKSSRKKFKKSKTVQTPDQMTGKRPGIARSRKRLILISGLIIVLFLYFFLIYPLIKKDQPTEKHKSTKIQEGISEKTPDDVRAVKDKAKKIYLNDNGFWEADYGDGIVMVYIPPGEFTMGSNGNLPNEGPEHTVELDGYWIAKYEVTVEQYRVFAYETDSHPPEWLEEGGKYNIETGYDDQYKKLGTALTLQHYPIVGVSRNDAAAYCQWLSEKKKLDFKLPTEAQWEKAARSADKLKYPWGSHEPYYKKKWYANYKAHNSWERKGEDGFQYTAPVGSYRNGSSPYGLMDMAGNVWELCNDWYGPYSAEPQKNPTGPDTAAYRVIRGCAWDTNAQGLRCTLRSYCIPSERSNRMGFRLCQDIK